GLLPRVIRGPARRRNPFAFGNVVRITSCVNSELVMLRSIARRWLLVLFSFLSPWRWRIAFSYPSLRPIQAGGRPVLELHPERQAARREHFLDLVQRLAAEV